MGHHLSAAVVGTFKCAASVLLQVGSALGDRLAACAATGALNLSSLSAAAMAGAFLPSLLPADWRGQRTATWASDQEDVQPACTAEWLQRLWQRLAEFPDLSPLADWPLVPIMGGQLCQPRPEAQVSCPHGVTRVRCLVCHGAAGLTELRAAL